MSMLQSILLATDFSFASQEAARSAVLLANAFASRVTIFHALEQTWPISSQEYQDLLLKYLAERQVEVADLDVGWGPPVDTVLRKAREVEADLILIGAGRQTKPEQFSVGPIATAIIEQAPQAVLAVRPGEPALKFRKILCPVDQSGPAGRGLRNAIQLARVLGSELIVSTVVPHVGWLTAAAETGQFADAQTEYERKWSEEFDHFVGSIPSHDVKLTKEVRHGNAHEQINVSAREHGADLIVVGATGRTGLVRALLGSTTRRLLEHLPCSLLVVKELDMVEEVFEGEVRQIKLLLSEARGLLANGAHEAAIAKFRQVLSHNPFHVEATQGLALAYEGLGQEDHARYFRERAEHLR